MSIEQGAVFRTGGGAELRVHTLHRFEVKLSIANVAGDSAWFRVEDIEKLRKYLKKLQKQLELVARPNLG